MELQPNEPKYISLNQLLQAKKKPFDTILLEQVSNNIKNFNLNNVTILKTCPPPNAPVGIKISTAAELIKILKNKEKIL